MRATLNSNICCHQRYAPTILIYSQPTCQRFPGRRIVGGRGEFSIIKNEIAILPFIR